MTTEIITVFIASYLSGSIPFGLILTKIFLNKDLRKNEKYVITGGVPVGVPGTTNYLSVLKGV